MSTPGRIYHHILALGHRVELPEPWDALAAPLAFFQPPADSAALLANLQQSFALDDLLAAGAVEATGPDASLPEASSTVPSDTVPSDTGPSETVPSDTLSNGAELSTAAASGPESNGAEVVVLAPALADPRSVLCAPRQSDQHLPRVLLGPDDSFHPRSWFTGAMLHDFRTQQLLRDADVLVVVASLRESAALWAAGVAAVPVQGLERLAEPRLSELATALGISRTASQDQVLTAESISWGKQLPPAKPPIHLVFANWSISTLTLERSPCIEELCRHFRALQTYLLPNARFSVWTPRPAELEGLVFLLRHGGQPAVRRALLASIAADSRPLCPTPVGTRTAQPASDPDSFWQLANECLALLAELRDATRRQRLWIWLQAGIEQNLLAPLLERARRSRDPVEQSQLYQLANLGRLLYPQLLRLSARHASSTAPCDARAATCLMADFELLDPLFKAQAALLRGLGTER